MTGSARNDSPSHKANEKAKPERKPMRRDAEKRRQQNIQAQRRYRKCTTFGPSMPVLYLSSILTPVGYRSEDT